MHSLQLCNFWILWHTCIKASRGNFQVVIFCWFLTLLILPHLNSIWPIILKIICWSSFNDNLQFQQINNIYWTIHKWKEKYFKFFLKGTIIDNKRFSGFSTGVNNMLGVLKIWFRGKSLSQHMEEHGRKLKKNPEKYLWRSYLLVNLLAINQTC